MTRTAGWCSASQRLTSRPDPPGRRRSRRITSGAASATRPATWSTCSALADELDAVHLLDRRGETHPEHRVVVDDGDADRRHGSSAGSLTWTRVPHGTLASTWTLPPSSLARSRIAARPTPSALRRVEADPVVGHVDLDDRAGRDRQPAPRRAGVAHDVGDGLGDDAVGRHLDGGRQLDGLAGQGEVDLHVLAERARELGDGADEPELVERRRAQVADDALELDDDVVDLVGHALEQHRRRRRRVDARRAGELADGGAQPE